MLSKCQMPDFQAVCTRAFNPLAKFPNLWCLTHLVTSGLVVINDIGLSSELMRSFLSLETRNDREVTGLDANLLSTELLSMLVAAKLCGQDKRVLTVFPGNGALMVKNYLDSSYQGNFALCSAKRFWRVGEDPQISVSDIQTDCFLNLGVTSIVAIDDVISSGGTLQVLCRRNQWKFPRRDAMWHAATWVSQVPRHKAPSGVNGYAQALVVCLVEGTNGRLVPINSLSTLKECPEIAANYAGRHFARPEKLIKLIKDF